MPCIKIAGFVIFVFGFVYCLEVIPERGNITYINPKFMNTASLIVRRYNRRGSYLITSDGYNMHTWGNNVTTHMVFHEYLHNEYRRSFVEWHYRLCDLIHKEGYVGAVLAKAGVVCPLPPGYYKLSNLSFQMDFPNVWPFERARLQGYATVGATNETIIEGHIDFRFVQNKRKSGSK